MHADDLNGSLRAVVIALHGLLPESDIQSIWSLIDAGEAGIALENVCTQLDEYDVDVDARTTRSLRAAARQLGLDQRMVDDVSSE